MAVCLLANRTRLELRARVPRTASPAPAPLLIMSGAGSLLDTGMSSAATDTVPSSWVEVVTDTGVTIVELIAPQQVDAVLQIIHDLSLA